MDKDKKLARPQNDATELAENEQAFSHGQWLYGEGSNREFCVDPLEPRTISCHKLLPENFEVLEVDVRTGTPGGMPGVIGWMEKILN